MITNHKNTKKQLWIIKAKCIIYLQIAKKTKHKDIVTNSKQNITKQTKPNYKLQHESTKSDYELWKKHQ